MGFIYFSSVRIKLYTLERPRKKGNISWISPCSSRLALASLSVVRAALTVTTCATFTLCTSTNTNVWKSKSKFLACEFHFRHLKSDPRAVSQGELDGPAFNWGVGKKKSFGKHVIYINPWLGKEKKRHLLQDWGQEEWPRLSWENIHWKHIQALRRKIQMFMSWRRGRHSERRMQRLTRDWINLTFSSSSV